jgi:NADPH:quinone reductase-like Zn-dependent oxidoreductase
MRAVAITEFGDPSGLKDIEIADPVPGPGQVVIVVEAIGVGGVDVVIRRGDLAAYGFREGHIPGSEVAGVVSAVGDGVDPDWLGRRVWAFTGTGGGYIEQALASAEDICPLPAELSADAAVTLGGAGIVAHFALAHAHHVPGESVLVRGAAGSIGIMTVQLAALGGASVVAVTTSSPERGRRLRELGATHVLDRAGHGQPAHTGFDVIIDVVAGSALPSFFDQLKPNGRLVVVGAVGGQPPADLGTKLMAAFQKSLTFATFSSASIPALDRQAVRVEQFAAAARGELRTVIHDVLPLTRAAQAHRLMDAGDVLGRVVLRPGGVGRR